MNSTNFQGFLSHLKKRLEELPNTNQLAFAASCCERAYPNYVVFSRLANWGNSAVLRVSLDSAWELIGGSRGASSISELEHKCEAVTPDLDDFSTADIDVQAAAGQEAAFMVRLLLRFCEDKDTTHAVDIATFARDTIDLYVQVLENLDPADPQLEKSISQHPLMLQEMQKQDNDLIRLSQIKTLVEFKEFRKWAANPERSNIGLKPSTF